MKITAIIADDNKPEGWPECFTADTYNADEAAARAQVEKIVHRFNATLLAHEIPRRLISVTLEEIDPEDATGSHSPTSHG